MEGLLDSAEYRGKAPHAVPAPAPRQPSAFWHYNARFDPLEVIHRHAQSGLKPVPGFQTNFLGVRVDPRFCPSELSGLDGTVEAVPVPANWHADIAEWGAALRAVDLAQHRFTAIELGCGWGCWLNNAGVAARRAGLAVFLIGVDGDAGHLDFARQATAANGFQASQVKLSHGIAAAASGMALFPHQARAGQSYGNEPVLGASDEQRAHALLAGSHDLVPILSLDDIFAGHPRIDLLHVDIQGAEADLIVSSILVLRDRVAFMVIGTHSRQIEGRLFEALIEAGWLLEIERPAILSLDGRGPAVTVDGVQGWRNPRLLPVQ